MVDVNQQPAWAKNIFNAQIPDATPDIDKSS